MSAQAKIKDKERIEQDLRLKARMEKIKNKIIIISGKGGVGKTTVAVNLAYGLAKRKANVGILDVDIHGPNVAKMLGIEGRWLSGGDSGIEPIKVLPNLTAVSLALMGKDSDQPIIWRGPLKMGVIKQFLSDVNWGELDYLIIDSPPGTGDEPLSVCQLIPALSGAVVVSSPQDVAILDSRKSVLFAKELKIPMVGIIENMSGLRCPHCGGRIDLFKTGGGEKAAKELGVPFLGRVPIDPQIVIASDAGKPFIHFEENRETSRIVAGIVDKIVKFVNKETLDGG